VTNVPDAKFAIAGLAITPDRRTASPQNGSIAGQKWNDVDGDQIKDPAEPGLEGWRIYIDQNNNGQLDTVTIPGQPAIPGTPGKTQTVSSASNLNLAIPDQSDAGLTNSLQVTAVGTILDINVTLDITHTWDSDLKVELISPAGTHVKLVTNRGQGGANFHNTVFDDSANVSISTASPPFTGTFRPETPLSALNGQVGTGTWQLSIKDIAFGDTGVLNSWSITIADSGTPDIPATPETTAFAEPDTLTAADGTYSFVNLTPSALPYHIREYFDPAQVAAGWTQTWAPPPVTVTSGSNIVGHDFGNRIPLVQLGSIQGQKFVDVDQDGVKDGNEPGSPNWIVFIDADNDGIRDISSLPTIVDSTDVGKQIKDLTTIQSQLAVDSTGSIVNAEVTLNITHSFVGDLEAYLTSPSGRRILLFSRVGGQYNDFVDLTLSDSGSLPIDTIGFNDLDSDSHYTGIWRPEEALSTFNGDEAAGIWTLSITDTVQEDEGSLDDWSLSFNTSELFQITDADGKYQFDNLVAGNYVVREEAKPGWTQVPPAVTTIPGATWTSAHWDVTVGTNGVQNVDFGDFVAVNLAGDYYRDLIVDASDYVLWRKTLGSQVANSSGADGDGNGAVEQADLAVWQANYGHTFAASGSGSGLATLAAASGAEEQSLDRGEPAPATTAQEPLSIQLASEVSGSTNDSAKPQVAATQVYELVRSNSPIAHVATVIESSSESESRSDLGLLAWLAASSDDGRPEADLGSSSDDDLFGSHRSDEPESVDVAFEMLEGNALACTAI
jgi:subtilisin-like proprotein convertase family protein